MYKKLKVNSLFVKINPQITLMTSDFCIFLRSYRDILCVASHCFNGFIQVFFFYNVFLHLFLKKNL